MSPADWFWNGAGTVVRTVVLGVASYAALVVAVRLSGKRTLSKLNAFDLVVTVALGSTLASMLLSPSTALAQGVAAFATLIGLQTLVAWLSSRSERVDSLVKSTPTLLLYQGRILDDALRAERVTEEEVRTAIREAGLSRVSEVEAVVLESSGSLSCVRRPDS